jgi:hypothetical protein
MISDSCLKSSVFLRDVFGDLKGKVRKIIYVNSPIHKSWYVEVNFNDDSIISYGYNSVFNNLQVHCNDKKKDYVLNVDDENFDEVSNLMKEVREVIVKRGDELDKNHYCVDTSNLNNLSKVVNVLAPYLGNRKSVFLK